MPETNADKQVRRFYEASASAAYEQRAARFDFERDPGEYAERLHLDKMALAMRYYRGGMVLDLCCATGQSLLSLAPQIDWGVGLDFSSRFIAIASKRSSELELKNKVTFVQGDAKSMPFRNGQMDFAYCFSSLYAIPRVELAISELSRVLRHGAAAVLDFGNIRSVSAYCSRQYNEWASIYPITPATMRRHLTEQNLEIIEQRCFQILPLWADRPTWLKPLLLPAWKKMFSQRWRGKMLDEWVSSLPGVRSFAFRHLLVCVKR